ncbi:MAG: hypothetical protein J6T10_03720 [Methanobrevibacter sp.]|nr:hypothetical protein [Methanobrevibacter sp.]
MTTNSKEYMRKYYAEHKEAFKEASRRCREKKRQQKILDNPNPRLFDMREDYKTPTTEDFKAIPEVRTTYNRDYYLKNRDRIRAQQKESRRRKKINARQRAYYAEHREHICELQNKSRAKRKREKKLSKSFFGRLYLKIFG